MRVKMKKLILFCLVLLELTFSGCVKNYRGKPYETSTPPFIPKFVQFGNFFFVFNPPPQVSLNFKNAKKVLKTLDGFLVEPLKKCVILKWNDKYSKKGEERLCLNDVPPIFPHIKVEKVNSAYISVRIISLFPRIALFFWEKKGNFPFSGFRFDSIKRTKPGIFKISSFSLGKSYFISGAVKFKDGVYGSLSSPILVKAYDKTPPLPPSGGGYMIKGNSIYLIWDKSPSEDIKGYEIKRENRVFFSKHTEFKEKILKKIVVYEIRAVDKAGNKSKPLIIKVTLP